MKKIVFGLLLVVPTTLIKIYNIVKLSGSRYSIIKYIFVIGISCLLLVNTAWSVRPPYQQINIQGKLVQGGTPVNGAVPVLFQIYDDETDERAVIWSEEQTVTAKDGVFDAILGTVNPIGIYFDPSWSRGYWLMITVDDVPLTPKQQLVSVPLAITARNLKGGTAEAGSLLLNPTASGAMVAARGKMYFNSDTNRMQYSDGSQWISLDPPYTSKPIKMISKYTPMTGAGAAFVMSSLTPQTVPIFMPPPATDCILVGCSGSTYWGTSPPQAYAWHRFKLKQGTNDKVYFVVHEEQVAVSGGLNRFFYYSFPFPIKVSRGTSVDLELIESNWTSGKLKDFALYYIELPLD